jgi:hypothetical protein
LVGEDREVDVEVEAKLLGDFSQSVPFDRAINCATEAAETFIGGGTGSGFELCGKIVSSFREAR